MDAEIIRKNGDTFSFEEHGIRIEDFLISSIPIQSEYDSIEGSDRRIDKGATFGERTIKTPFHFEAYDLLDFPLFRDFIFGLILSKESFYIREKRRISNQSYGFEVPGQEGIVPSTYENKYVGGKRYLVRLQNTFDIDQIERFGRGSFTFETTELPFAESTGTTQDIQRDGIDADSELWGFGMGLIADDEALKYTHAGTAFRIYNAGNVPIHPFEQELKIIIKNAFNSTEFLRLKNLTNGTAFKLNEGLPQGKELVLDGPIITIDGLNALRRTNRQFLELEPGWNEFELTGVSSARVEFDFRFYYK